MNELEDFSAFEYTAEGFTHTVYYQGSGPAVIIMHELPGMIPQCVDLTRYITQQGFTVFLPLLFGKPNQPFSVPQMLIFTAQICISREFYCLSSNQSSPITTWLKALCREAKARCNGQGVGVIGMCLTGGFVLSMIADESVLAPVISQPALPFAITSEQKSALGISDDELLKAQARTDKGLELLALRFSEDKTCPAERFARLRKEFNGAVETVEIDSSKGNPHDISQIAHAVLTFHFVNDPAHPTYQARERVVSFLKEKLQ